MNWAQQKGLAADAQAADHLGLVADADLPQLDAGAEHAGQVLDQLAEVHAAIGGEEKQDLAAVKATLHPHQLHLQLVLLDLLFADVEALPSHGCGCRRRCACRCRWRCGGRTAGA